MRALVLAAGRGSRISEFTKGKNKCLIDIGGRSVLEWNLEMASIPEIDEIIIVVGHAAFSIINDIGTSFNGKRIRYVYQELQNGLVDAMECAAPLIGDEDFVLFLGDQVLTRPRIKQMIKEFYNKDRYAMCGIVEELDHSKIKRTYCMLMNDKMRIHRLIEKPRVPLGDHQGTGFCVFRNEALKFLKATPLNPIRMERELPDWIQVLVDKGKDVYAFMVGDKYTNINTEDDLLYVKGMMKELSEEYQDGKNII